MRFSLAIFAIIGFHFAGAAPTTKDSATHQLVVRAVGPKWTWVENADNCFKHYDETSNFAMALNCIPFGKPEGCNDEAWHQLSLAFRSPLVAVGPPGYLAIQGHQNCLDVEQSGSASGYCMPAKQKANCTDEAWEALNSESIVLQSCSIASEDSLEEDSSEEEETEEEDQLVRALPPPHLSISHHEDCLSTQSHGSFETTCLPSSKPDGCAQSTWNSLMDAYKGEVCGEALLLPQIRVGPPQHLMVEGGQECLKMFQASGAHQETCLPVARPDGCSQEAFDELMAIAFGGQADQQKTLSLTAQTGSRSGPSASDYQFSFGDEQPPANTIPKVVCQEDAGCPSGQRCHTLTSSKVCVPAALSCDEQKQCPKVGTLLHGMVTAQCVENLCNYAPAQAIA